MVHWFSLLKLCENKVFEIENMFCLEISLHIIRQNQTVLLYIQCRVLEEYRLVIVTKQQDDNQEKMHSKNRIMKATYQVFRLPFPILKVGFKFV